MTRSRPLPPSADAGGVDLTRRILDATTPAARADAIHEDGLARLQRGEPVTLDRYFELVPGLADQSEALDAAISVALASMALQGDDDPSGTLIALYPRLEKAIRDAAVLNSVILKPSRAGEGLPLEHAEGTGSATRMRGGPALGPRVTLPRDFGPLMPDGVPRYKLVRQLGAGAFGEVYLAKDRGFSDPSHAALVAVKILREAPPADGGIDEALAARRIDHPNVVRVLDRGISPGGEFYIVYEYVRGGTLARLLAAQRPPWPAREAAAMVAAIARGVQASHAAGILHCDIKPSNILIAADGTPKVSDFGVSISSDRLDALRAGYTDSEFVGNLAFIAPEQFQRDTSEVGAASDVYSVGGLLYHLLTGELPNGRTRDEVVGTLDRRHGRTEAPRLKGAGIDGDLEAICRRALAPRPASRYDSAGEFAADLESWLSHFPIRWTHPGPVRLTHLAVRRNPIAAGVSLFLVLLLLGGAVLFTDIVHQRRMTDRIAQVDRRRAEMGATRMSAARDLVISIFENKMRPSAGSRASSRSHDAPSAEDLAMLVNPARSIWTARFGDTGRLADTVTTWAAYEEVQQLFRRTEGLFWKAVLGGHALSDEMARQIRDEWRSLVGEEDDWLQDIDVLLTVFAANRIIDSAATGLSPEERDEAADLAERLAKAAGFLERAAPLSPQRALVLITEAALYEPGILDDPSRRARLESEARRVSESIAAQAVGDSAETDR